MATETLDALREKTAVTVREAEDILAVSPPALKQELITIEQADPQTEALIRKRMGEIDIANTQSIIKFGSKAQEDLTAISDEMLDGVRNKDVGPAGSSLRKMVTTIRGFNVEELVPRANQGFFGRIWAWITGRSAKVADFVAQYEQVRGQIDKTQDELLGHETKLLKDIKFLDKLYDSSLKFLR